MGVVLRHGPRASLEDLVVKLIARLLVNMPQSYLKILTPNHVVDVAYLIHSDVIAPSSANVIFKALYERN